ncbi:molybdopterin dinucleotide binding domain-containing protein, partial [Patulibacter sp. S7RM1-6]
ERVVDLRGDAADDAAVAQRQEVRGTVVAVAGALQRAQHGEQPLWAGVALAAMLGRFEDGAGFAFFLGGMANWGRPPLAVRLPAVPQGRNPVDAFVPVARIADLLLEPGGTFAYDGGVHRYPHVRLVHWAGGNPFHHHQDLGRLERAWARPDTIVVHEPHWTATARRADIVLPATITLEREDLGASANDPLLVAMHRVAAPYAGARDDHDALADVADRLGFREAFTGGRTPRAWLEHLYEELRADLEAVGAAAPTFARFWAAGELTLPTRAPRRWLRAFVADPEAAPLPTPSGRIEITSERIAGFGYADCPPHPTWLDKDEEPDARRPLHLLANQPATRLHSQLDFAMVSREAKVAGREPLRLHPDDAAARGIAAGDVVRVHNERGACLAGALLDDGIRAGACQLATGAWYDPDRELGLCRHGNPNVLTRDAGTSALAQGSTGALTRVQVERWTGPLPPVAVHGPPPTEGTPYTPGRRPEPV